MLGGWIAAFALLVQTVGVVLAVHCLRADGTYRLLATGGCAESGR